MQRIQKKKMQLKNLLKQKLILLRLILRTVTLKALLIVLLKLKQNEILLEIPIDQESNQQQQTDLKL